MDYDHARKAGNAADVWKHFCLLAVTARVLERRKRCRYVDTHAGAGQYPLDNGGEWQSSIGRLASNSSMLPDCHYVRNTVIRVRTGAPYPGSWQWVLSLANATGQAVDLCLFDTNPRVIEAIPGTLPGATIEAEPSDGFRGALRCPSADLVLVDPPYTPDVQQDWERVMQLAQRLEEAGVCFLVWYPLFLKGGPAAFDRIRQYSRFEIEWAGLDAPMGNLRGCGLMADEEAARTLGKNSTKLDRLADVLEGRFSIRQRGP